VTSADAQLLAEDPKAVADRVNWALERLIAHERLEAERRAAGIKTDMQRYLDNEPIRD
jgi:hypothetical protein